MRKIVLLIVLGALGCGGGNNHAPVCAPSAASASLVMAQSTGLDAHASDQDGDPLTYSWAQTSPASPPGSFSSQSSATPTWTAPTVAQATQFSLAVTVSDGKQTTTCSVMVFSRTPSDPSFHADVQPLLVGCVQSGCHNPPLADQGTLVTNVAAVDCPGQRWVKPGDPDHSVLYKLIAGTSCRNQMPPTPPYVAADQVGLVRTWIAQGALDN